MTPDQQTSIQNHWDNSHSGQTLQIQGDVPGPNFSDFKGQSYTEGPGYVIIGDKAYFDSSSNNGEHQNYLQASSEAKQWDAANDSSTWGLSGAGMGNLHLQSGATRNHGYSIWGDGSGSTAGDSTSGSNQGSQDVDSSYQIPAGSSVKQTDAMKNSGVIAFYDGANGQTYVVSKDMSPNLYSKLEGQINNN